MSKKLNAIVPDEVWGDIDVIAKGEMRTKSQMTAILLSEAIAARRASKAHSSEPDSTVTPTETKPTPATKAKRGKESKEIS